MGTRATYGHFSSEVLARLSTISLPLGQGRLLGYSAGRRWI